VKIDKVVCKDGSIFYCTRKTKQLHREDGPAVIQYDGSRFWYRYGKFHREDGPAIEWADGYRHWYIDGELFTEEDYVAEMKERNPMQKWEKRNIN